MNPTLQAELDRVQIGSDEQPNVFVHPHGREIVALLKPGCNVYVPNNRHIRIVIFVDGGLVQGVVASEKVIVEVIDADNMRGEGRTREDIEVLATEKSQGMIPVF